MPNTSERPTDDTEAIVHTYGNTLYRICLVLLGNETDAEDAIQETFLRYFRSAPQFQSSDHQKAWLITVATNQCKDMLRYRKRHPQIDPEFLQTIPSATSDRSILEALMTLPEKFRLVLTLYYVEDYSISEIARTIRRTPSAVKMRLQKGRRLLEETYRKEYL